LEAADKPLLRDLLKKVKTTEWYRLGLELKIDIHSLDIIECNENREEDKLKRVFQKWLKVCSKPSWRAIINALRAIHRNRLATELEDNFCT